MLHRHIVASGFQQAPHQHYVSQAVEAQVAHDVTLCIALDLMLLEGWAVLIMDVI